MISKQVPSRPSISTAQRAWLTELGIDRRLLATLVAPPATVAPAHDSASAIGKKVLPGAPPSQPVSGPDQQAVQPQPVSGKGAQSVRDALAALGGKAPRSAKQPAVPLQKMADTAGVIQRQAPATSLSGLQEQVAVCQACNLHTSRHRAVFGSGAVQSPQLLVIGDAPGQHDDRVGLPFQGPLGELLKSMLAAINVNPDDSVFFTNILKCRPPARRSAEPAEVASCLPYLQQQIALLQPARLLLLGPLVAQALLHDAGDFEQLRGRVHQVQLNEERFVPAVLTYHPGFLLTRPQLKLDAWHDLNLLLSLPAGA